MEFFAHIAEDGRRETVKEHLTAVGDTAASFAGDFDSAQAGRLVGQLHDIGKYSDGFQQRICEGGSIVDHSTAGASFLAGNQRLGSLGWLLAYSIAGHHGGLPDGGSRSDGDDGPSLQARLARARTRGHEWWERAEKDGVAPKMPSAPAFLRQSKEDLFSAAFWVRMVFSCLVDADFLCTEEFMQGVARQSPSSQKLPDLRNCFEEKIAAFYPPQGQLNEVRCRILDDSERAAYGSRGFYSLTVPTGGGKTLASMRFALHHATQAANPCKRIIYAIPYTSIIEQNAGVFRDYLGVENVLEHHGGFDFEAPPNGFDEGGSDCDLLDRLRLACENWDAPVVVTTNVQLFDSLFSCKTSKCRKLHNIANSIIVLDEAQMLPVERLEPCLAVLEELVDHYGCTVVFCTATQPALSAVRERFGIMREICSDVEGAFSELARVSYDYAGSLSDDEIVDRLLASSQSLCIVNSRKQARVLYEKARARSDYVFHLSTLMYPEHRSRVIDSLRKRLKDGLPCRVISTSLVEAGVDLDFPTVLRAFAGLDSIVQAAGRCNREGSRSAEESHVVVFDAGDSYGFPAEVRHRAEIARSTLQDVGFLDASEVEEVNASSLASPAVVAQYFERLYDMRRDEMDKGSVLRQLRKCKPASIPFRSVADSFHLIEDPSFSVIIPCAEIEEELDRLQEGESDREMTRKLSRFAVSVYECDLRNLLACGVARPSTKGSDLFVLCFAGRYSQESGLDVSLAEGEGMMM